MQGRQLCVMLCGLLVLNAALAALQTESVAMLEEDHKSEEGPVKRNDLKPTEEDQAEKIGTFKDMKRYIYTQEKEVQKSAIEKDSDEESEELAIGDTLKSMEAKHAVEDELQMEIKMDCEVGEWGKFGPCSKLCDGGLMKRERAVERQPQNGGKQCPDLSNEVECNTDSCASEAYQRRATRRKLTAREKAREHMANRQKIALAMQAEDTHTMMKRTREVMRKMVHTEIAQVRLPGETEERSPEAQVRKSLQEAMAKNAVTNAMKTFDASKVPPADPSEQEQKAFKETTQAPVGP